MQRFRYAHDLDSCYDLIPMGDAPYQVPPDVARRAKTLIHPDISFHWISECAWPEVDEEGNVIEHSDNACGFTRHGALSHCPRHQGQRIIGFWGVYIDRPVHSMIKRADGTSFKVYEWKPLLVGWLPPLPLTDNVLLHSRITYADRWDAVNIYNTIKSDRERYRRFWRDEYYHFTKQNRREIQDDINLAMNTGFGRNAQISTFVESEKGRRNNHADQTIR